MWGQCLQPNGHDANTHVKKTMCRRTLKAVHCGLDYNCRRTKPTKKIHRSELKTTYKARTHIYRYKTNVYSNERVHTAAYSVFKPTLSEDYQLIERGAVLVGIQHKWFRHCYSCIYVWLQKYFFLLYKTRWSEIYCYFNFYAWLWTVIDTICDAV